MFDLSDTRSKRRRIIFGEAQIDAQQGAVLAAMDFEWTCRRAILALSKKPTVVLYEKFITDYPAFGGLENAWNAEVRPALKDSITLPDLVGRKVQWSSVRDAMQCRNAIVHGTDSRVSDWECRWAVCVLEDACDVVAAFVKELNGKGIFTKISRRRTKDDIEAVTKAGEKLKNWHKRVGEEITKRGADHWISTGWIG